MKRYEELINLYLTQRASKQEVEELDNLLQNNAAARRELTQQTNVICALEGQYLDEPPKYHTSPINRSRQIRRFALLALAAVVITLFLILNLNEKPIASLVSNEDAAWESVLPTTAGSELTPGTMFLKTGVATIRFSSGAIITLESPAQIELETAMRAKLLSGNAYIEVPDSAKGFILDTPNGYAVDYGTAFAVSIDNNSNTSSFEVLEGEISLHNKDATPLSLEKDEAASIHGGQITKNEGPVSEGTLTPRRDLLRISTAAKSVSVVRCNEFDKLHPDFLMVKLDQSSRLYERRSFIQFDTETVDWQKVKKVNLRLNLVPCGLGYAARLKKVNQFALYGLPKNLDVNWNSNVRWEDMPPLSEATKLATFEVPRSQLRGTYSIESQALREFLKTNQSTSATFILTRETVEIKTRGLVHSFASDSHPESSGPTLEIKY